MSVQIPNLHVSTLSSAKGKATVEILPHRPGNFTVELDVSFDPAIAPGYPRLVGPLVIDVNLTDSVKGAFLATLIEQVNSFGKDTPTIALTGRCDFRPARGEERRPIGCSFWLLIADNKRPNDEKATPDIISFVTFDSLGNRLAYGTGPVVKGDITVTPTLN